jgi:hypothetical protein
MKKNFFIFFLALSMSFALTACKSPAEKFSEKASEKMAEKAIENAVGGNADVDVNGDNVNVNTKEGNVQVGEKISLPADFPKDVYVYEGTIKAVISNNSPKGYTVSIETDKAIADIKAAYEKKIVEDGWENTGVMDFGDSASISGKKDNRMISVMIGKSDDKTSIVLGVNEQ